MSLSNADSKAANVAERIILGENFGNKPRDNSVFKKDFNVADNILNENRDETIGQLNESQLTSMKECARNLQLGKLHGMLKSEGLGSDAKSIESLIETIKHNPVLSAIFKA